jgi:hypothetical protein
MKHKTYSSSFVSHFIFKKEIMLKQKSSAEPHLYFIQELKTGCIFGFIEFEYNIPQLWFQFQEQFERTAKKN